MSVKKLNSSNLEKAKRMREEGRTLRQIGEEFGLSESTISLWFNKERRIKRSGYSAKYSKKNREKIREARSRSTQRIREYIEEKFNSGELSCSACGATGSNILRFYKNMRLQRPERRCFSLQRADEVLSEYEVFCYNCAAKIRNEE